MLLHSHAFLQEEEALNPSVSACRGAMEGKVLVWYGEILIPQI